MEDKPLKGILKKESSSGAEAVDLSLDDDRKPSAASAHFRGVLRKEFHQDQPDFEPVPLNEMASIPRLSSSEADTFHPSARPRIADIVSESRSRDAFPRASPQASMPRDSFAAAPRASEAQISPVISPQSKPATRKQRKKPARCGSCGTTGSTEGEGWEKRYNELIEFRRRHDHCEVPQNYPENTSLGFWVNKQRMEHKNRVEGKTSSLTDCRLERLESIGFRWGKRKGQASWDEKFNELAAYRAKFGNCHVPTKYKENTALGRWVSTQRSEYKKYREGKKRTIMNPDKIRRLETLGFAWSMAL